MIGLHKLVPVLIIPNTALAKAVSMVNVYPGRDYRFRMQETRYGVQMQAMRMSENDMRRWRDIDQLPTYRVMDYAQETLDAIRWRFE